MTLPAVEQARPTPVSSPPVALGSPRPGSPGSTRRTIGAVLATAAMALVLGGAATAVALRLVGLLERPSLNPADPLLVLWVVIVILLIRSAIGRPRPLRPLPAVPTVVQSSFRRLVEASYFGTGSLRGWTITDPDAGLDRIVTPHAMDRAPQGEEPPDVTGQERTGRSPGPDARAEARSAPAQHRRPANGGSPVPDGHRPVASPPSGVSAGPVVDLRELPTVEHTVARGETFWSLAERSMGDGRHWPAIQQLNAGREVAPRTILTNSSVLRPGWNVLLPATSGSHNDET